MGDGAAAIGAVLCSALLCDAMERAAKEYSTNKNVKTHEVDDK